MPTAQIDAAVREACLLLEQPQTAALTLEELAGRVHVSPDHLTEAFRRQTGVTPREYRESLRLQRLQAQLRATPGDVAGAAFAAGFGSLSAAYEASTRYLGMTPATYGARGAGAQVLWSLTPTPFGQLAISATTRGLATVYLGPDAAALEEALHEELPAATLTRDDEGLAPLAALVAAYAAGESEAAALLPLDVRATAFQWRVWRALRAIPRGEVRSYAQVAESIGSPSSVRAVARACATNPVAIVTPCHRVVRSDGSLAGFRWGLERKAALLQAER